MAFNYVDRSQHANHYIKPPPVSCSRLAGSQARTSWYLSSAISLPCHDNIISIRSLSVPVIDLVASFTWECQQEIPAVGRKDFNGNGLQQITPLVDFPHVIKCHLETPVAYNHQITTLITSNHNYSVLTQHSKAGCVFVSVWCMYTRQRDTLFTLLTARTR